ADEVADPPDVEPLVRAPDGVDLGEIVRERLAAGDVEVLELAAIADPREVLGVRPALGELHEDEELVDVAERDELAARAEASDVERGHVPRQAGERLVVPQEDLRAIGHVLVAERPRAHGLENGRAPALADLVLDAQRRAVAVALELGRLERLSE